MLRINDFKYEYGEEVWAVYGMTPVVVHGRISTASAHVRRAKDTNDVFFERFYFVDPVDSGPTFDPSGRALAGNSKYCFEGHIFRGREAAEAKMEELRESLKRSAI